MSHNGVLTLEFETDSGNEYIYDGVTNRVFFTPAPMRAMIANYRTQTREQMVGELSGTYDRDTLEDYYEQIQRWVDIDHAFFLGEPISWAPITPELDWQRRRENHQPVLSLVTTYDCNLRCKYCIQDRLKESMSFATAQSGIDRFWEANVAPDKKVVYSVGIAFYGGESLLEYDLMQQCVAYVKAKASPAGIPVAFTLATNGTLLTDTIVEFLVQNGITIAVSLDGPKEEHDRNRVTKSGVGTFDLVYDNLMRIKHRYPEYYATGCMLSAVYDYATDLRKVVTWFHENRSVLPRLMRAALASWNEKTCDRFSCDVVQDAHRRVDDILRLFKEALVANDQPLEKMHETWRTFLPYCRPMTNRRHFRVWRMARPGCYPGLTRLALYPDGTFRTCDRIETQLPIGDVHRGIDVAAVAQVVSQFRTDFMGERDCHTCISQHSCTTCYANTIGGADTGFTCERERAMLRSRLKYWFSVFEANPAVITVFQQGRHTILEEFLG